MPDWDLAAITSKWQRRWWDAKVHHAERPADAVVPWWNAGAAGPSGARPNEGSLAEARKPSFFVHFAYPGISGYLHVGHMRGFTYTDVFARYKRMTGHRVLFPAGFHASGIPAVAFATEVKRGEKTQYLLDNGYDPKKDGPVERLSDPKAVVDYFARVYTNDYWKAFGFLIDERRNCTTIDPAYSQFIRWQFRALKAKGFLIEKPHYSPFCPVAGPVAVDKTETDLKQGGNAEILEFTVLKFRLPKATVHDEEVILPCATLRPETVFGATNVWVRADSEYHLVRVWEDGRVKDSDPSEVWCVSAAGQRKLEWQFERAESLNVKVLGKDLVDHPVQVPMDKRRVPIVAGSFVDPQIATGVVMSVPGHAPFDYAAYRDAGLLETLGKPPKIVDVEGVKGIPAEEAVKKFGVKSQADKDRLDQATEEIYTLEFNQGVLNEWCGAYAGKRVKAVKDQVKADAIAGGHARILRQFSELVVSRAGEIVDIKRVPDQDFIHYADKPWTEASKQHAATMRVFPERYKDELPNVLDWFGDRACVRRGAWLGTEFPFKPGWIVEPIADSTFYPWFYVVQRYVKSAWNPDPPHGGLELEDLTGAFFDYVFNGKGAKPDGDPPAASGDGRELWREIRRDVLYWGPVDLNLGGKEHQTVHFPVYVMTNVALLDDPRMRPRGIFVNWWVTQKAGAKISKSKGGAEPIPGAAAKYGVDPMRLYYCHVGSPHVDIEWDPDIVLDYRKHVERALRAGDDALNATGAPGPMDAWLTAAFGKAVTDARAAYEAYDVRVAANVLVYTVPEMLRWYTRRGGANAVLLRRVVQDWAKALCPMLPHVAEEMHERAGGKGLATTAAFPTPAADVDAIALAREDHLKAVLDDVLTVKKLANVERVTSLALYTTHVWKRDLVAKAIRMAEAAGGKFPMGQFMSEVMADPGMRTLGKSVQAFTGKLPGQVTQFSPAQKALLLAGVDEAAVLRDATSFIAQEIGVPEVPVFAADDPAAPEHPKKGVAGPLKPGIALS